MTYKKALLLIVLFSILAKIAFLFISGGHENFHIFEQEVVANNLLGGEGFYYTRFHSQTRYYAGVMPGFPILCYIIYKAFGHHPLLIIFIQIAASSFIAVTGSLIARRFFSERAAILACLLIGFHPALMIYSTHKLHPMSIYALLFSLLALMFMRLRESPTIKNALLAGVAMGVSFLFRSTSLVISLLGIFWFFVAARRYDMTKKAKAVASAVLIAFVLILPWGIRNYLTFGRFQILQTVKGESLWWGNAPGSVGSLYTSEGTLLDRRLSDEVSPDFFSLDEARQSRQLAGLAADSIKKDLAGFIKRTFRKVYYFWYFSPYQGALYPKSWMLLYKIYYLVMILPALFSVIYNITFRKAVDMAPVMLLLLLFLAVTGVHSLYFVEGRHRWSIEGLVLIFTAHGIMLFYDFLRNRLRHNG